MKIRNLCKNYFGSFSTIKNKNASKKEKTLARISITSYFLLLPPLTFVIGYALSSLCKSQHKVEKKTKTNIDNKTEQKFVSTLSDFPEVSVPTKEGFFVRVLNKKGYKLNGKNVSLEPGGIPEKFEKTSDFKTHVKALQSKYSLNDRVQPKYQLKDRSTEQAIQESDAFPIALNFANEQYIGGPFPGFYKDPDRNMNPYVYKAPSAKTQEESISQRSTLMDSLLQIPHTLRLDERGNFVSDYKDLFDSRKMAYVSLNQLFGVQGKRGFFDSEFLKAPKKVAFITSAANCYGYSRVDCSKNSKAYADAKERIETHLLAAASKAAQTKKEDPYQSVEVILGAYGCGDFAPQKNPDEYREMIAGIYKELLPEFNGFFDVVTFAVPTFGNKNPVNPSVANYRVFESVLSDL